MAQESETSPSASPIIASLKWKLLDGAKDDTGSIAHEMAIRRRAILRGSNWNHSPRQHTRQRAGSAGSIARMLDGLDATAID